MGLFSTITQKVSSGLSEVKAKVSEEVKEVKQAVTSAATAADSFVKAEVSEVKKAVGNSVASSSAASNIAGAFKGSNPINVDSLKKGLEGVKGLWNSPNKGAALATEYEIDKLKLTQKGGLSRLTPDVQDSLVQGVAARRSDSDHGGEKGVLNKGQAADAAKVLVGMSQPDYDGVKSMLDGAGKGPDGKVAPGADPQAEKALILKAVAARKEALGNPATAPAAMAELKAFANDIRGTKREELIRTTSGTDTQGASNAEGTKQGFFNTCAPTVAQMYKAEGDPVYARQLSKDGGAAEQKQLFATLSADAGKPMQPVSREESKKNGDFMVYLRDTVIAQQNEAKHPGPIPPPPGTTYDVKDAVNLIGYVAGQPLTPEQEAGAKRAMAIAGPARGLSEADFAAMRKVGQNSGGVSEGKALTALGATDLVEHEVTDTDAALKAVKSRLADGKPVPISIAFTPAPVNGMTVPSSAPGHALLATDYRDGKYLISDPMSGKTAWVPEADLKDGSFATKQFALLPDPKAATARFDGYYAPN